LLLCISYDVIRNLRGRTRSPDLSIQWEIPSFGILEPRKHDISETGSVSETSCFLVCRIPDDGESPHHRQNPLESTYYWISVDIPLGFQKEEDREESTSKGYYTAGYPLWKQTA
jgi:hypothetical protein